MANKPKVNSELDYFSRNDITKVMGKTISGSVDQMEVMNLWVFP